VIQEEEKQRMFEYIKARLANREDGQSLAEYALILALIAVVAIAALTALGGGITNQLGQITASL
jgi:pilus assembly protein Flp/PilA